MMIFVVEQLKSWLKLAAPWADAAGFIVTVFLYWMLQKSNHVHHGDRSGVVYGGEILKAQIKGGRRGNLKDLSM